MLPSTISVFVVEFSPAGSPRYWAVTHKKLEWVGVSNIFKAYRFSNLQSAREQAIKLKGGKVMRVTYSISGVD